MKCALVFGVMMVALGSPAPARSGEPAVTLDPAAAGRFASLALKCVHQEYPNKIAHTLAADADVRPPRELYPAFHGCYDWHSAVHAHWLLARLVRRFPDAAFVPAARAELARRVLDSAAFARWLKTFMPAIPTNARTEWLTPAVVTNRSDPKLAHLDGLNLSRAWMLEGIARGLEHGNPRMPALAAAARAHRDAALPQVTGEHYEGGHWLGTFAVYLVTH